MTFTPELAVAIAFVIFLALVLWKGTSRITAKLDNRAEEIRDQLDEARKLREAAQSTLASYERQAARGAERGRGNSCSSQQECRTAETGEHRGLAGDPETARGTGGRAHRPGRSKSGAGYTRSDRGPGDRGHIQVACRQPDDGHAGSSCSRRSGRLAAQIAIDVPSLPAAPCCSSLGVLPTGSTFPAKTCTLIFHVPGRDPAFLPGDPS